MELQLLAHSTNFETMIASSMLTTTSGAQPSTLFNRLLSNQDKVQDIVSRVEVQHGNILEHNRLVWRLTASDDEVLDILLRSKFFNLTRYDDGVWIVSSNLRTLAEYHQMHRDEFSEKLVQSISKITPQLYKFIRSLNA
jgi:hypothetical protein